MVEPVLKALVQLFALISDVRDISEISIRERDIVRLFLSRQLNNEMVNKYMELFDEYFRQYSHQNITRGSIKDMKRTSLTAVKILGICEKINEELQQKQKLYVLVQLLDFIQFGAEKSSNAQEFLETVSIAFNVPQAEFRNVRSFILESVNEIPEKKRVMIIDNKPESEYRDVKHLYRENLNSIILLLHIESSNTFILKYSGKEDIFLNGQNIFPDQTYAFDHGSTIRTSGKSIIYFNDVSSVFSKETFKLKISLDAIDVNLRFNNSDAGIQNFNFHEESGNLVGIMGGSGVGKTTLLGVLSGVTKPLSGQVLINGYDLYSEEEKSNLEGVIGFVPQDDLLIEELTVYQNLYYSAKMCLDNLPENKLVEVVNKTLSELELNEIRDLKVGNSLNKVISGGQRKRLNIALELIREPTILFVDEPTSGLSSVDSETVMTLLKEQTDRGKLIIINIHQPGSDIYKMFDKIMLIDKGGYLIFYGNPSEAIVYFKSRASYANANEDQCVTCGNVNSDQLLQIIESKVINENGKQTHIRKVSPKEWAEKFNDCTQKIKQNLSYGKNSLLPENYYSIPGLMKQSKIFFTRDILSKLANRQYVMISLLGSPLLALLLAYFTKYTIDGEYNFSENENIISYLFMCIITSLFLGLIISAEEIVKDRKILKRESFLNLSWFSYLNSKVMIMFMISAIQTIAFILIGNFILEIKGMTLQYWFVLFTTSCLANLIGLNISSAFTSVITIYILIPFILIPQLLFSGVIVNFDKLHKSSMSSHEYVPLIGDLMATRWSYEALATEQFKNNRFERNFFPYELEKSQNSWYAFFLIPELQEKLKYCLKNKDNLSYRESVNSDFYKLNYHLEDLSGHAGFGPIPETMEASLNVENFNQQAAKDARRYLDSLDARFKQLRKIAIAQRDSVSSVMIAKIGSEGLIKLKSDYYNKKLEEAVLDRFRLKQIIETDTRMIQKYEPGYMKPTSPFIRAHFYAPYKQAGNIRIDTFWFNLLMLWTVILALYIALYYNLLQKLVNSFEKLELKKAFKKLKQFKQLII
jgi:ABC-type multidrug transport system ATPase subunit